MAEKKCFEDLLVGSVETYGDELVTREAIIAFATQFDPQPFHLSDEAAAVGPFKRLAASGWQTASLSMKMLAEHVLVRQEGLGGAGTDKLRWHQPVYPGDRLHCRTVLTGKRRSASRPEMGLIFYDLEVRNQDDQVVLSYTSTGMIRVRHPERV